MKEDKDTGCGAETVGGSDGGETEAEAGPAARSGSVGPTGPGSCASVRLPEPTPLRHYKPSHLQLIFNFSPILIGRLHFRRFFFHPRNQNTKLLFSFFFFFVKLEMHGLIFSPVVLLI